MSAPLTMTLHHLEALYAMRLAGSTQGTAEAPDAFRNGNGLPPENILQLYLVEGRLGDEFQDEAGRLVRILDFGEWNHLAGPDFLQARITIAGEELTGDIELDPTPEDWERHGHGSNPNFNHVVLHLCCSRASSGEWFTRNSRHEHIACAVIPPERVTPLLDLGTDVHDYLRPCDRKGDFTTLPGDSLTLLLRTAAAFRFCRKHDRYARRTRFAPTDQVLYEYLAETLGYHANKHAMRHLAMRVPLRALPACAESVLFGTAGFLLPMLPASSTPEAVTHHKHLWTNWWPQRESFELSANRQFPWHLSGSRPVNHPQRRIGALAAIAGDFAHFATLCTPDSLSALTSYLQTLKHPYWSTHVTLPSAPSKSPMSLMGKDRIESFIINTVLPASGSEHAWQIYLQRKGPSPDSKTKTICRMLLGDRPDAGTYLKYAWQQQALLQIAEDFCSAHRCETCSLLEKPFPSHE